MPRIRKKTSNRGTTHQREKIKKKAAETRKKKKKEAKKNPQWKSKKAKDPGIPNNFPYKDQILAEVAEQRRIAAEEKQKRKEAKKLQATAEEQDEENPAAEVGVSTLPGTSAAKPASVKAPSAVTEEDEEPILLNPDLPNLGAVIDKADVVVQLLDTRDPLAFRSSYIEDVVKSKEGKKLVLVLNKIDACPKESVEAWTRALSKEHLVFLFRSASAFLPENELQNVDPKGKGKKRVDDALGLDALLEHFETLAKELEEKRPLNVAVLGWTNVGKSSFVNSLAKKSTLAVYKLTSTSGDGPTTTLYPQEVTISLNDHEINMIDTPGLLWQRTPDESGEEAEHFRTQDILLRSKGHIERLKDPLPVVSHIANRAVREDLMLLYNIPIFADGDINAFLSGVARANGYIKKGGVLDFPGASKIILKDWRTGKFPRYTVPSPALLDNAPALSEAYQNIISTLKSRKEMRTSGGLVKLRAGGVERREVNLEKVWIDEEDSDEDGDGDDDEDEEQEDGMDVDEESEEEEEEGDEEDDEDEEEDEDEDGGEEEEPKVVPQSGKRKQGPTKIAPPPKKKVAFSARHAPALKSNSSAPAPTKSALKPSNEKPKSKSKPSSKVQKPAPAPKVSKVANPSSKAAKAVEDGAYDFGKFF